jgi:hypothetical protein
MADLGVHMGHCCTRHGCKYLEDDCPVVAFTATQNYPCESCSEEDHIKVKGIRDWRKPPGDILPYLKELVTFEGETYVPTEIYIRLMQGHAVMFWWRGDDLQLAYDDKRYHFEQR